MERVEARATEAIVKATQQAADEIDNRQREEDEDKEAKRRREGMRSEVDGASGSGQQHIIGAPTT